MVRRMVGPVRGARSAPLQRSAPQPRPVVPEGGASRPVPPDLSKIVAWLCCDPLPPLPLGPEPMLMIGRTDPAQLVLPHKEVSRRHALIKVRGKMLVLEDEGSSNGVYVNGQRVSSSMLKVGDKLTIGPYELELRSNEEMAQAPPDGSTPTNLALTSLQRIQPGAAMTGRLDEVAASELLQQLEFNKKTGTLTIHLPGAQGGELVVKQGRPVRASLCEAADDEAVIQIALLRAGRFTFSARVEPGDERMRGTLTGLLLEASRRIDEGEIPTEVAIPAVEAPVAADEEPTVSFRPEAAEAAGGDIPEDPAQRSERGLQPGGETEPGLDETSPAAREGAEQAQEEPSGSAADEPPEGEERQDLPEVGKEMDNKDWQTFWGT